MAHSFAHVVLGVATDVHARAHVHERAEVERGELAEKCMAVDVFIQSSVILMKMMSSLALAVV